MKSKKSKNRGKADVLSAKKSKVIAKKPNPFELHQQKEKFSIINQRTTHSRGQPLKSRQLAVEKRKQTLGVEFNLRNKSNTFQDQRKSGYVRVPRESIYNLNDSEMLTHSGQTLAEIERFDDVDRDDDEMSDDEVRLDAKFTEAAHFGNFPGEDSRKDRKTVIDELIAESKKRKVEKARNHEEVLVMTDKLDNDWRELFSVVNKLQKTESDARVVDDYDRLVKEMIFEPRGEPTEKLKSEDDIARVEKDRLEKLERERLERMREDDVEGNAQPKHRSADDLDDGYFLEPVLDEEEEGEKVLSYAINGAEDANFEEHEEDERNGNELDDGEGSGEEEEDDEESEEDEESEDDLEDLKADEESEDEQESNPKVLKISDEKVEKSKKVETPPVSQDKVQEDPPLSKKHAEILERIPYTIMMPASYEKLIELLENHPAKIQSIILDRIIKTNHPKLVHVNKAKMLKLFAFLLQYINDSFSESTTDDIKKKFKILLALSPILYDLIQMNPEEASNCYLEVIREKHENFRKSPKHYPHLDTLIFIKILGALYPTSDFRHPIVTPVFIFIHHILSQAKVRSRSDVARGLLLATLVLDSQQLSKKFLPAVMNFLNGVCYLCAKKTLVEKLRPTPPFKKNDSLLLLEEKIKVESLLLTPEDLVESSIDEEFKVRALNLTVHLMADFVKLYDELVGMKYFLDPFEASLTRVLDVEFLPKDVKKFIKSTFEDFKKIKQDKKLVYPQPEKKVQPMLRLLEPKFETVLSDRRTMYSQARGGKTEERKLKHMVKREFKSAKRELRRDNEFISKIRQKRRQEADHDRAERVKRIFNEASVQQSEFNALSRTKGRKGQF